MKRLAFLLALVFLVSTSSPGQAVETSTGNDDLAVQKLSLLFDLQSLGTKSNKLDKPLARALAKAEVADAAWSLDQEWAKKLLREAYKLTFPDEDEQTRLRDKPAGSEAGPRTPEQRARDAIQSRILGVARRDAKLAQELAQFGTERLGVYESHLRYTTLALQTLHDGDKDAAAAFLLQAIEADPTQVTAPFALLELAEKDPKLGDRLILQYIERLRTFPLSIANRSTARVMLALNVLVFHALKPDSNAPLPGPAVMRAYVSFILEYLRKLEQTEPGSLQKGRGFLLMTWPVLQKYTPDLTADFLILEQRSRGPNDNSSLLTWESLKNKDKADYETRLKDALESDQPNEIIINRAISRGDFSRARKLIDKLSDGPQKSQLAEMANAKEALYLLKKDALMDSRQLAEKLKRASSILEVYPALIGKCISNKDEICATSLMVQAMAQLKTSEATPPTPPAGIPTSIVATSREFDPILDGLAKLTLAVLPLNDELALEGLDETVFAANVSQLDTGQGQVGFDVNIFRKLAPKNAVRVQQTAESFKDPLRQIVSLAAIYQWKAGELKKAEETRKPKAKKAEQ